MIWSTKNWEELTTRELFEAYKLRTDVFVVEQGCPYPEVDEHDLQSRHLFAWEGTELIAYARICPPNTVYREASLGRIVLAKENRNKGIGRELVCRALADLKKQWPDAPVKIQAQQYLESFYASFGFETIGESYPDVMVMHVDMKLKEN